METELSARKTALRNQIRAVLETISAGVRDAASAQTADRLRAQPIWKSAKSVLLFAPLSDEPHLWPVVAEGLAAGKLVALPRYVSRARGYVACQLENLIGELAFGKFRVREPLPSCPEVPMDRLDLVLVPGVAFDLRGGRLGRGRGFYDRLLTEVRGVKCGVGFDEQIVAEVPAENHDVRMDIILTPTQWVKTGS